jgi:putative serine/threonine protein kinase
MPLEEAKPVKTSATVPTESLTTEPYASILCYPKATEAEVQNRIEELKTLGVSAIEFTGKGSAFNVPVLGKGFVGVVVAAHLNGQCVALKIRRVDADRSSLLHEAEMLTKTNAVLVGPRLIGASKNFLLMQLIEGDPLPAWLKTHTEKEEVLGVLTDILEQCWRLDGVGVDHGELSKAPKHLIVNGAGKPWIIDFETASDARKPANVTAVCQYLFMGGGAVAGAVAEALGERNRSGIIEALRCYKKERTRKNFDRVQQVCLG